MEFISTRNQNIRVSAAEAILRVNDPVCAPADSWGRFARRGPFELYRLVPPVSRQNSTLDSSEVAGPRPAWVGTWRWKLWRAFGKAAERGIPDEGAQEQDGQQGNRRRQTRRRPPRRAPDDPQVACALKGKEAVPHARQDAFDLG